MLIFSTEQIYIFLNTTVLVTVSLVRIKLKFALFSEQVDALFSFKIFKKLDQHFLSIPLGFFDMGTCVKVYFVLLIWFMLTTTASVESLNGFSTSKVEKHLKWEAFPKVTLKPYIVLYCYILTHWSVIRHQGGQINECTRHRPPPRDLVWRTHGTINPVDLEQSVASIEDCIWTNAFT